MADVKNIKSGISVSQSAVVTISNDLFVRGKITEYSGLTDFSDNWSGMWEGATGIIFILVREKDLTYTVWAPKGKDWDSFKFPFVRLQSGLKPTQDACGNYTILNLQTNYVNTFQLKSFFTKKSSDDKIAMAISSTTNLSYMFLIKTISPGDSYTPSDPVKFIEEYNRQAGELLMKRAFNLDTVFDLKNTWQELGNQLNQTNSGQQTLKFIGTEKKIQSNMNQKSFIELSALHDKLATSTIDYKYIIKNASNQTVPYDADPNKYKDVTGKFIIVKYNFKKANEQNKITLFDHVKISDTGCELDNVPYFKVSRYFHTGYANSVFGAQIDEKCFQVALRSPLNISGGTLNFRQKDKYGRDNSYNITVPPGYTYPTDLADKITELLGLEGCELRVILYNDIAFLSEKYVTYPEPDRTTTNTKDIPRYAILSDISNAIIVTAVGEVSQDLLTRVLDLSGNHDVSGIPLTNAGETKYLHKGGTNILPFTPFPVNNISGGHIIVTHGNAATTLSPRNYYATLVDMIYESNFEEHTYWIVKTAPDLDGEFYVPETWNNYQLWLDDKSNLTQIVNQEISGRYVTYIQKINSPAMEFTPGIAGPPGKNTVLSEHNASIRFNAPYKNILNISDASAIYNAGGYTFRNYLDTTYRLAKETIYADVSGVRGIALISRPIKDDIFNSLVNSLVDLSTNAIKVDVSQVDMSGIVYSGTNVWRLVTTYHYDHRFGIMKQSVVAKLLPADASNIKVGYYYSVDTFYPTTSYPYNQDGLTKLMNDYFEKLGVKLVVQDYRGNLGGSTTRTYCPFGPTKMPETLQSLTMYQATSSAIREQSCLEIRELMTDVLKNPNNYSPSINTYVNGLLTEFPDGSNNLTRRINGGITSYTNTRFYNGPSGEGINVAYLTSDSSISGSRGLQVRINNCRDNSGRFVDMSGVASGNIVFVGTTPTTYGSGGSYTKYDKHIFSATDPNTNYMNNTILNGAVAQVSTRVQTTTWSIDYQGIDDKIGECYRQDAITDHKWDTFLIEIGKKTHPDISGVVFSDNTTWRDLGVEKALKCAYKGKPALDALGQSYGKLLTDVYQNKLF